MDTYLAYRNRLLDLYTSVQELHVQKVSGDEMRKFIDVRLSSAAPEEVFGIVGSLYSLFGFAELHINVTSLVNFVTKHKKDFLLKQLWATLEVPDATWDFNITRGYTEQARIGLLNIEIALVILWILVGQKEVEQRVLSGIANKKIGPHVALAVYNNYFRWITVEPFPGVFFVAFFSEVDYDFIFQLLRYVFQTMPEAIWKEMRDERDRAIARFSNLYKSVPYRLSAQQLQEFLERISAASDRVFFHLAQLSKTRALELVQQQYLAGTNHDYSLGDYDELQNIKTELTVLSAIFIASGYKRQSREAINVFLRDNPVSIYWQARMLENSEEEPAAVRKFIDQNLSKFSYDEMLFRVVHTYVSESIEIALYTMMRLSGLARALHDVTDALDKGVLGVSEAKYLLYNYQSFPSTLGVSIDVSFCEQLGVIVEQYQKKKR